MVVYPAIFHKSIEGGYVGTWLYDDFVNSREMPVSSKINDISIEIPEDEREFYVEGESFKTLIGLDMLKYVNECKNQTVRKNVSIPSWLNEMAKKSNINFSNILQEALKHELGID